MITLNAIAHPRVSLADALAGCGLLGGTALLAAPDRYHVARVDADGCFTPEDRVDLDPVFEARVFTPDAELRWLHESDGTGRAVLLTEDPALLPGGFPEPVDALSAVDTLSARYLVWGEMASGDGDWTTLTAGRIGELRVPVRARKRAQVTAVEYVAVEPDHGNAFVAEERLIRLEPYEKEGDAG